jgi:UPF0755 protein
MMDLLAPPEMLRRRRARVARIRGVIAVLLALAVVGGGIAFVVVKGKAALAGALDQQRDYTGTGTGTVTVTIAKGSTLTDIGAALTRAGVVFNADAFVRAAGDNDKAQNIQAGTYRLRSKMSGAAAVGALLDLSNRVVVKVTIPEGMRAADISLTQEQSRVTCSRRRTSSSRRCRRRRCSRRWSSATSTRSSS